MVKPLEMTNFGARNEEKLNDSTCFQMHLWHNQPENEMNFSSSTLDFTSFVLKKHFRVCDLRNLEFIKKYIFNSVLTNPTVLIEFVTCLLNKTRRAAGDSKKYFHFDK